MKFDKDKAVFFKENGYCVIEDYLTEEQCDALLQESKKIIEDMDPKEHNTFFSTDDHMNTREEYFLNSGDKIAFFWEPNTKDEKGNLLYPKEMALNKIGHALHVLNPVFNKITFSDDLPNVLKELGFVRPLLPQSMVIFKNKKLGGVVSKHIDASFLESTPLKLVGFWIPLVDTTTENGCLWMAPGSHKNVDITFRMIRNPDKTDTKPIALTGKLEELPDEKYIPVPMKKGSLVLIDGKVQHKSHKNESDKDRPAYTFHIFESHNSVWSPQNWLQETSAVPFTPVYDQY